MAARERNADASPAMRPEIRRGRVRERDWERLAHGLYLPAGSDDAARLAGWAGVLPASGALTHLTAASIYGWWLPPGIESIPVFASQHAGDPRPRRPGLRVSRHHPAPVVRRVHGLPVTSPAETLLACARDLSLLDLVVLIDSALAAGSVTAQELAAAVRVRRVGAPDLRRALAWADGRSESAWETLLRVLHVSAEVPVVPQHTLLDEGGVIARGDLWLRGTRVFHEYDGGDHLTVRQQRADLARQRRLLGAGWARRAYTAREVVGQGAAILRDADVSLGRVHRSERIRPWHRLLAASLYSESGAAAFRARLRGPSRRP